MSRSQSLVLLAALGAPLCAQNPCEGNGVGNAYLSTTAAIVGGTGTLTLGSPTATNSLALLLFGNGAGPTSPFCLETNLLFLSELVLLDGTGNATVTLNVAPTAFPIALYAKALVLESNFDWSLSKTVLVSTEFADSWRETGSLAEARSLHSLTPFQADALDNVSGALVAGGATGNLIGPTALATTEVYDVLDRAFTPGPNLAVARARHAAARLPDGSVLLTGGMTNAPAPSTGGPATATCERYLPASNTIAPFPPMLQPRLGHAMTVLGDGRVLVSGGFADWTDAGPNFVARLDTALTTTEIYDPVTGLWTAGPTMSSRRGGHTHTLLADGRVLITAGCNGGATIPVPLWPGQFISVPTFTASCDLFDPGTNGLTQTGSIPLARGFHGQSRLANGNVLVTGGAALIGFNGEAAATNTCAVYDPATGTWSSTGNLLTGVAFHTQVADPATGAAIVAGGGVDNFQNLIGTSAAARHDGVSATALALMGSHPQLTQTAAVPGSHAVAVLGDGTILSTAGFESSLFGGGESARCFVYIAP